mmetsp:Transcript_716/g.1885  ORF Transcript_716/g.1885 Transcript_716/m.1885 type:complete len:690 (-) Transcript_716:90-2159(-)
MEPNDAAVRALQLAQQRVPPLLCEDSGAYLDMELVRHMEAEHSTPESRVEALASAIRGAFGDMRALNECFCEAPRVPAEGTAGALAVSDADELLSPAVDWEQLDTFWAHVGTSGSGSAGDGDALIDAATDALTSLIAAARESEEAGGAHPIASGEGRYAHAYAVLLSCPALAEPQHHETILGPVYEALFDLPEAAHGLLSSWWSKAPPSQRAHLVSCAHTYIIIAADEDDDALADPIADPIRSAVSMLGIVHAANEASARPLEFSTFYNDAINSELAAHEQHVRADYARWMNQDGFSLCEHAYVLDPASKASVLKFDAIEQMASEFEGAVIRSIFTMSMQSPYLVLRVRRDHLIRDCLHQLASKAADLKKPLKVHFVGEEGVDEGGVQKEFFQLATSQLFDPNYGMFVYDEGTRTFWFNEASFESKREFELIGMLLGIAIYNSIIVDVRFPHVVYKKLRGSPTTFDDLRQAFPALALGLQRLLEHDGDVAELGLTFSVTQEVYGEKRTHELVPGGADLEVSAANRDDYVRAYVAHVLNGSVERQFGAFRDGFHKVCGGEALELFRWEELELLICGSPELDFDALEKGSVYEDGFSAGHATIRAFWQVVHDMEEETKRRFLVFCTGSDRVPIKGLSGLRLVISRHGSDESRLPSAHTCFNHLLLPEYKSIETLRTKLLTAIRDTQGFHIV